MLIVFFAGVTLWFYQAEKPKVFLREGVPVALCFWSAFLVSLLFVTRFGYTDGFQRWGFALVYLIEAVAVMFAGLILELAFVMSVGVLRNFFNAFFHLVEY